MKYFLEQIAKFFSIALAMLLLCESIYFYTDAYQDKVNGWEVYVALNKSKKKHEKVKRLLIGDSVAMQIYPCDKEYDDMVSLACNQAITMAGYYFLLKNYCESNEKCLPDEVVLMLSPFTLGSNLDQFAYHYFLKPFNNSEYSDLFSSYLIDRIEKIKCHRTANLPFVRSSNYSPSYSMCADDYVLLSPISIDYYERIKRICDEGKIALQVVFVPSKECNRLKIESMFEESMKMNELPMELYDYWEKTKSFFPDNYFKDNVHFLDQYIPRNYLN